MGIIKLNILVESAGDSNVGLLRIKNDVSRRSVSRIKRKNIKISDLCDLL